MTDAALNVDVLIVGCGPAGLATALALSRQGISCLAVTRSRWLADTPRAHITNLRTMEVLRDLGVEPEVLRSASPWRLMGDTPFAESLAGEEIVRLRTWGTGEERQGEYRTASPCAMADIIQPELEPILLNAAAQAGAAFRFATTFQSFWQDDHGVTATLNDALTGEFQIRARYLVGADGASSRIVEHLGLPIEGHMARAGTVYTLFNADLSHLMAHRPSILNWILSSHSSFGEIGMGLLRAVRPWTEWIAGWGFDITKGEPDLSENALRDVIEAMIGEPAQIEIKRTSLWYVNQAYATKYSSGRVFCLGDAVHRHPPSSGLGLNTCVQDGFNLAWKLAYVLREWAGPGLLDSFSGERAPVGKQIVLRANQSRLDYAPLRQALRDDSAALPLASGLARFRDHGTEGIAARARVAEALALKNHEFNALGIELNQRYFSSAVLLDDSAPETWAADPVLHLQATTRPGAKIPHVWLVDEAGRKISTLDVVGRGRLTLMTGLGGLAWEAAAAALDLPFLKSVVIGRPHVRDVYCAWARCREIDEAGALLIRADGHVAWRQRTAPCDASDAERQLRLAISEILDRPDLRPQGLGQPS